MNQSLVFALNHITSPQLSFKDLVRLAKELSITAVEIRNDLPGVAIQDGTPAPDVRREAEGSGIRILSINALQRFNEWGPAREAEGAALARYARNSGAEALVLCPVNSREDHRDKREQAQDLRRSLKALLPILRDQDVIGLVEPLGFEECSLRKKRAAVEAIDEVGGSAVFKVVHDTFHHYLAGELELFPTQTGLVHISGVEDGSLPKSTIRDEHRVLVGPADLMDNVGQIRALRAAGYPGPFSFEAFAASVHALADQAGALRQSMSFVRQGSAAA